ncbi:hypothetical protein ATSB10_34890 [Dyella thiooxydans]|uniref:Uncharacterized protein n=1 Tax=Dyella thiooxydans TaxID=445710 RepID=A0A160N4G9_9GAMM|nr:hypothetical protein [Dyella thiooxydans]AND70943.1 hypothetical protein ATSB10_34890 [Dyella thiooxydans]
MNPRIPGGHILFAFVACMAAMILPARSQDARDGDAIRAMQARWHLPDNDLRSMPDDGRGQGMFGSGELPAGPLPRRIGMANAILHDAYCHASEILVGRALGHRGFTTPSYGAVLTRTTFAVQEWLKPGAGRPPGSTVQVWRIGGSVQIQGHRLSYAYAGQRPYLPGHDYLLFLRALVPVDGLDFEGDEADTIAMRQGVIIRADAFRTGIRAPMSVQALRARIDSLLDIAPCVRPG